MVEGMGLTLTQAKTLGLVLREICHVMREKNKDSWGVTVHGWFVIDVVLWQILEAGGGRVDLLFIFLFCF